MSGLLWPRRLPVTELFRGFADPPKNGLVETTTPPETGVGPEGTLPEIWLPVTSMPLAPRSAMPIPEKFLSNFAARHERVLSSTVLPLTSKPPTCSSNWSASKTMPAQLLRIVFPAMEPRLVTSPKYMPHAPPEMLLPTTLASLLARSGPKMRMPASPERLMSLETILVPVESRITVPTTVLSVMSLERILVPVEPSSTIPTELPVKVLFATVVSMLSNAAIAAMSPGMLLTSLLTTLVRELSWTTMPSALVSGLPITWFFATVVLMLTTASIPPATLPMARFPTTVVLRAPRTSITNAVSSPLPAIL